MEYKELNDMFKALTADEQVVVTEFFNLHNMAIRRFNGLSREGQSYVNSAIEYSQEVNELKLTGKVEAVEG